MDDTLLLKNLIDQIHKLTSPMAGSGKGVEVTKVKELGADAPGGMPGGEDHDDEKMDLHGQDEDDGAESSEGSDLIKAILGGHDDQGEDEKPEEDDGEYDLIRRLRG